MYCNIKILTNDYDNVYTGYDVNTMVKKDFLSLKIGHVVNVEIECDKHYDKHDFIYSKRHTFEIVKIIYYKNDKTGKPKKFYGRELFNNDTPCKFKNNLLIFYRNQICPLSGYTECYCTDKKHKRNFPYLHTRIFYKIK